MTVSIISILSGRTQNYRNIIESQRNFVVASASDRSGKPAKGWLCEGADLQRIARCEPQGKVRGSEQAAHLKS
ncbi:MAG: hypothetical protein JSU09_17190 [Bacteroidetes bacterium]|nr:hypothetical protein [Bacteroidota bacterium]